MTKPLVPATFILLLVFLCTACGQDAGPPPLTATELQTRLDAVQAAMPKVPGFSMAVLLPDGSMISASTGQADPDGRPMTADTPVRQASITKPLVAAAILRLHEEQRLDLDATIDTLISRDINTLLASDGYDPSKITVRHLLLHASGLNDHFPLPAYQQRVLANPDYVWTPMTQLQLFAASTDPLDPPGQSYFYSDPGYILLGLILERLTQEPMGEAVRDLLDLQDIGLQNSWWEGDEPSNDVPGRAHQWLNGGEYDAYYVHGSVDAFGGGGLIASVEEITRFFAGLFAGQVFNEPTTLELMTSAPGKPADSEYLYGLFGKSHAGLQVYGHGGFWGTDAVVVPELQLTMAGVALDQSGIEALRTLEGELIELVAERVATAPGSDTH